MTTEEKSLIDKKVEKNRKNIFRRKITKIKFKKKKVFITLKNKLNSQKTQIILPITIFFAILVSNTKESQSNETGSYPFRSTPIHSLYPQGGRSFPRTAPAVSPLRDKVVFQEVPNLPHKKFIDKPEISKVISELRAGDLTELIIDLIVTVLFFSVIYTSDSFHMPPNGRVIHPNGGVVRPANRGIQEQLQHPPKSSAGRLRMSDSQEVSTSVIPTQTQVSGFVQNGEVDLTQAFDEVNRRAAAIGNESFECSFDRFKELATECGEIQESSVREAITALQGEMQGHYTNVRRLNYGPGVKGPDYAADGRGEFEGVTHNFYFICMLNFCYCSVNSNKN